MVTGTAQDGSGLWQAPRQDLFVFQEHPETVLRVISGPLNFVAASNCKAASELLHPPPLPRGGGSTTYAPCLFSAIFLERMINNTRKPKLASVW